jgi:hypothetical protein
MNSVHKLLSSGLEYTAQYKTYVHLSSGVVSYSESSIQANVTGFETKISITNSINSDIFEKSAATYSVIRFFACYVTRQLQ